MQFPVPQFTDVEDKIVAGLTFKQFAIVFGAAVFTFVIYTITKNVPITLTVAVITGTPALALTFGKLNGRPLYSSAGNFIQYLFGAKVYVYHKEGKDLVEQYTPIATQQTAAPKDLKETAVKINELNYLLQQHQSEEAKLVEIIKSNRTQSK
ncbi:MAG TPA: PrgI family protein [Candidatus Doudnabacteria bacterium]|nr:PrgI family protein [Candidatus Doudnabacteria bacterium]